VSNNPPEISNSAAEAVADVYAVRLPPEPAEGIVVATTVSAKLQIARFCSGVVRVVDTHERSPETSR
jgi:hypothetical protein